METGKRPLPPLGQTSRSPPHPSFHSLPQLSLSLYYRETGRIHSRQYFYVDIHKRLDTRSQIIVSTRSIFLFYIFIYTWKRVKEIFIFIVNEYSIFGGSEFLRKREEKRKRKSTAVRPLRCSCEPRMRENSTRYVNLRMKKRKIESRETLSIKDWEEFDSLRCFSPWYKELLAIRMETEDSRLWLTIKIVVAFSGREEEGETGVNLDRDAYPIERLPEPGSLHDYGSRAAPRRQRSLPPPPPHHHSLPVYTYLSHPSTPRR